jgi:hypothetical protein
MPPSPQGEGKRPIAILQLPDKHKFLQKLLQYLNTYDIIPLKGMRFSRGTAKTAFYADDFCTFMCRVVSFFN